ncbi:MAG: peptide deformylase [Pseudoflavonifractor sp.]|nr:peptide deformylase [Alloprevotella sp.]MCM1116881.1 peptide deformylase [Pseudoflavonifractor sp.]
MRLPIYLYGHPVLRAKAQPIDTAAMPAAELQTLIDNMFDTMYASEGVGLAAPQVGKSIRLVVVDGDALADKCPECAGFKRTFINPVLEILDGDPIGRDEGCLSIPGLSEKVDRVEHIRISYLDRNLNEQSEELFGFAARMVQHEFDHLEGKVYTDRVNLMRKQLIRNKLNGIANGKITPEYPFRTASRRK